MAVLFFDGFDKYGPAGQTTPSPTSLLTAEWTTAPPSVSTSGISIVAGLSATGQAVQFGSGGFTYNLLKTIPNTARIIGGVRFSGNLAAAGACLCRFLDGSAGQCSLTLDVTGSISLRTGAYNGTVLSSGGSVSANTTHYVEWDITIGASGAYQVWLDGASLFSGTGNTRGGTSNNYANSVGPTITSTGSQVYMTVDDFYLFDSTGSAPCNAPLLSNPIVETAFASADTATKQWTNGATVLGLDNNSTGASSISSANTVRVRAFTAPVNMTLNSISIMPAATNGGVNLRPVVYATAATGAALLASGSPVTGVTNGAALTMPLTTPLSLTAGTSYAIGVMIDTGAIGFANADALTGCSQGNATFASGAPGTLPTMTAGQSSWQMWGNCTDAASDWPSVSNNPANDDLGYISSSTVGQEELFAFPNLLNAPAAVHAVAYKARLKRSDSGTRTIDVRCNSNGTESAGTAAGVTPGPSFGWNANYLPSDPNTGLAWTGSGVNAATAGVEVAS